MRQTPARTRISLPSPWHTHVAFGPRQPMHAPHLAWLPAVPTRQAVPLGHGCVWSAWAAYTLWRQFNVANEHGRKEGNKTQLRYHDYCGSRDSRVVAISHAVSPMHHFRQRRRHSGIYIIIYIYILIYKQRVFKRLWSRCLCVLYCSGVR